MSEQSLTKKQQRAVQALAAGKGVADAARSARVKQSDLLAWLSLPEFRQALSGAEGNLLDTSTRRLLNLQSLAVSEVAGILADRSASHEVRLRAAGQVIDTMLRLREMRDIEQRLQALEQSLLSR